MKTNITTCKNHLEASQYAADLIAAAFAKKPDLTVTFAAGDTPFACYRELLGRQAAGNVQLTSARYIGLDEWMGLGPNDEGSCIFCMNQGYYQPAGIPKEQMFVFDGLTKELDVELARMRKVLDEHPLDLAVLGIGVNGHIGFNEPGVPTTGKFSFVPLSESTQQVGKKYFSGRNTPTGGATITLEALQQAETVVILATGKTKRDAVRAIVEGSSELPACAFLNHPNVHYVFDEEAMDSAD